MKLTRRNFLAWAGVSAVGAVACEGFGIRYGEFDLQSPVQLPEDLVKGTDNWYATLCRNCASAAQSLNQKDLAKSLQELAERLLRESDDLKQNDALCDACNSLNRLERELAGMKPCPVCKGLNSGQCSHCSGSGKGQGRGAGSRFVRRPGNGNGRRSDKKGGLKAGRGSAKNWFGGNLAGNGENRLLTQNNDPEGAGRFDSAGKTVSARERAQSALAWKKKFLKNVQKAEADLELERVPHAYRNYLRRYFKAIQPKDDEPPPKEQ